VRVRGETRLVDDALDARAGTRAGGAIGLLRRLALFRGAGRGHMLVNPREITQAGVRVRSARAVLSGWATHRNVWLAWASADVLARGPAVVRDA
jgi:hypothetical protein